MSDARPDQWLVRTHSGKIKGPFVAEELREMILSKKLELQDEVAQANHYWFSVSEYKEVETQLGVQVPMELDRDEEGTITETDTDTMVPDEMPADGSSVMAHPKPEPRPLASPTQRKFVYSSSQATVSEVRADAGESAKTEEDVQETKGSYVRLLGIVLIVEIVLFFLFRSN